MKPTKFLLYSAAGEQIAECKHVQDAAAVCRSRGEGCVIRTTNLLLLWTEPALPRPTAFVEQFMSDSLEEAYEGEGWIV